jgi:hypothetical protein
VTSSTVCEVALQLARHKLQRALIYDMLILCSVNMVGGRVGLILVRRNARARFDGRNNCGNTGK